MGMVALVEMGIFLSILIVGLAYVWVKSDLDWIKEPYDMVQVDIKKLQWNRKVNGFIN